MENIRSWTEEDESIIATNTDATECKRCAVELGYWKDEYVPFFAKHVDRKAPEINRGYYARVKVMELFIHQFLERCGSQCQIINLGCGFDTLYWRLNDHTRAFKHFVELDLPSVASKKCGIIKRNKRLLEHISEKDVKWGGGGVSSERYHLVSADLRDVKCVRGALRSAGALVEGRPPPTLLLLECVLVYMSETQGDALLALLAELFPSALLLQYEPCGLGDRFGNVMERALASRGCRLHATPSPEAAAERLTRLGWERSAGYPMSRVWSAVGAPPEDARNRDPLDEAELLQQLHAHYAFCVAANGPLLADLDLELVTAAPTLH